MKKIGITTSHYESELGFKSNGVNKQYHESIVQAGGIPVLIPILESDVDQLELLASSYADSLDMLLLTGGSDITPILYQKSIQEDCGPFDLERDNWELLLIDKFRSASKPIMGICRGFQLLNVAFKGTLIQHMKGYDKHWHNIKRPHQKAHEINLHGDTLIEKFGDTLLVNSFHHQCIDRLSEVLKNGGELAISKDNVIEMLYNKELKILGVQYHPEMMPKIKETDLIFELFLSLGENSSLKEVS